MLFRSDPAGSITVDMPGNTPLLVQGVAKKAVFALKADNFAQASDGGVVQTDTSGAVPTPNALGIGSRLDNQGHLNGTIRSLAYYPNRLANATLQALTS